MAATARKRRPTTDLDAPALTSKEVEGSERVPVFTLDGKEYTAPAQVSYGAALAYMRATWRLKASYAEIALLERLLGPEAVAALETAKDLRKEQYRAIVTQCTQIMLGSIEEEAARGN